ncbi:PF11667 family protein [Shuttleworthella sp. MSX8B]|uniref:metalloprotease family protein n=1 Tax=Shuttleworthella sp. MSX8B TaxID=936574 RepID=UPI000447E264|nr:metalloprotease family protein [Shuttleworthia sp. MSX8B]EUB12795.1 PF11667 family protein [Shuttleworthia sp. MSX8B]
MAIVWEGNKKEFGTSHQSPPVQQNAVKIRDAEGFIGKSLPFGIAPMMICMLAVFLKAFTSKEAPISPIYLVPAFLIGFMIALPIHEFAHAVCYPKEATVWVGLCVRKMQAWAISYHPLTKRRFICMSLAPALLGIIPLIGIIFIPITMKPLLTICVVSAFMGLISPAPDYMDAINVMRKVPKGAVIRDSQDGLYAYLSSIGG